MFDGFKKVYFFNLLDNLFNDNENKIVEIDLYGKRKEKNLGSFFLVFNKSDEDGCNVEFLNEGVGLNVDNSEYCEEIFVGIKEGFFNNNNFLNESKDNLFNSNEKLIVEIEIYGLNMEKYVKGFFFVKNLKLLNMVIVVRLLFGRGRGIFVVNFYGRL